MKNNQETIDNSPNQINILDLPFILNDSEVRKNFRKMYKIGAVALHESAFAVYNIDGQPDVSKLLLPKIYDQELYSENARNQHQSPNVSSLVLDPRFIEIDYGDDEICENLQISENTQQRINAIKNNAELSKCDKRRYIESLIALDQELKSKISGYRNDIVLMCHNHPQSPFIKTHPNNIIYPSIDDLNEYDGSRKLNPDVFEGIIASDGSNNRLMLYRAKKSIITKSEEYDIKCEYDGNNAKKRLASLAISGYSNVVLELTHTGEISKSSLKDLDDYLAVIESNKKTMLQLSP